MIGPEVMLASSTPLTPEVAIARLTGEGWWYELKFDGIRAVVERPEVGAVRIFNRRRVDITSRYPDVVDQLRDVKFTGLVDGEIVVAEPGGRPTFSLAHLRDAQVGLQRVQLAAQALPATFMPFDVLERRGENIRGLPYLRRHELLAEMFAPGTYSMASQDGATMWQFVQEHELEGLVAKRPDAAYRAGRQKSWLKIKATHQVSALVCGVIEGKGTRGSIGSLQVCLWDTQAEALVPIGRVGSGLSQAAITIMRQLLATGDPIVVDVEYLEVSPSGLLRNPVFKGVRQDIAPQSCTLDTLPRRAPTAAS